MQIVHAADILHRPVAEGIGGAVMVGPLHACSGQKNSEPGRIVVAAAGPLLECGHSAEFRDKGDERVVEQSALLEIAEESGHRLIEDGSMDGILLHEFAVAVPVAHPLPHRIGAVEELHKPDSLLQKPAGQNAVAGKPRLGGIGGIVSAIERKRGRRFC